MKWVIFGVLGLLVFLFIPLARVGPTGPTGATGPEGPGMTVKDESTVLPLETTTKYTGAGVTCVHGTGENVCTITGSSGSDISGSGTENFVAYFDSATTIASNNDCNAAGLIFDFSCSGNIAVGTPDTETGCVILFSEGNDDYGTSVCAHTNPSEDVPFLLPANTGSPNQPLVTDGSGQLSFGTLTVAGGGTGATSCVAYAVVTGGTTSTNPHQCLASVGSSGQVLTSNGAAALPSFQNASGGTGATATDIQTCSNIAGCTWTKPANAVMTLVELWGAGGGGDGGNSGSTATGGVGGGGGAYCKQYFPSSVLSGTETMTPGTGGTGGTGATNFNSPSATSGSAGGNSSLGTKLLCYGGDQGGGGTGSASSGLAPGNPRVTTCANTGATQDNGVGGSGACGSNANGNNGGNAENGGAGGAGPGTTAPGAGGAGGSSIHGCPGGGGGGSKSTIANSAGGAGGVTHSFTPGGSTAGTGGTAGGGVGGSGGDASGAFNCGEGAGGGGGNFTGTGGNGGVGGSPGAGGGGGGGAPNPGVGGNGGDGGDGFVRVTTFF